MDHHTYGIVGDGCLMEGVAAEAASLAGHLRLGKLIYLYDDNHITIEGGTELAFTEDVAGRFEAYGWQVLTVDDGNDLEAIDEALAGGARGDGEALAHQGAHHHRLRQSAQGRHGGVPRGAAGRRGGQAHQRGTWAGRRTRRSWCRRRCAEFYGEVAAAGARPRTPHGRTLFARYERSIPSSARQWDEAMAGRLPEGWKDESADVRGGREGGHAGGLGQGAERACRG